MSEKSGKDDLMNQDAEVVESSVADAQEIENSTSALDATR